MLLDNRQFFVKERVALGKLTDTYDIFDPQTNTQIGIAHDEPSGWAKLLRLVVKKRMLPTTIRIYEREGLPPVLSLHKKAAFLRTTVIVTDDRGSHLGTFRSKVLALGGGFLVYDEQGNQIADVKGDWKGWNFRFLDTEGRELGLVTKKWAGIGKELFTSADNYMISLSDAAGGKPEHTALLLAAGLAIDTAFKEHQ